MKTRWFRIPALLVMATAALIIAACSGGTAPPSKTDVATAFTAISGSVSSTTDQYGYDSSYSGAYVSNPDGSVTLNMTIDDGSGGSITFTFTVSNFASGTSYVMTGQMLFTNWRDPGSGYVFNGNINFDSSYSFGAGGSYPIDIQMKVTGDLRLAGGSITTLSANVSETMSMPSADMASWTASVTGTVTANGTVFNASEVSG